MIKFEYNGKIYAPSDLDKKLQKLGITKDDIKILEETTSNNEKISQFRSMSIEDNSKRYCFWHKKCKGWFDSKDENLNDWPFNKEDLVFIGQQLEDETVEQAHKRLFKLTFTL